MAETFKFNVSESRIVELREALNREPSSCRNWGKSTNLHPLGNSNLPEEKGINNEIVALNVDSVFVPVCW